MTHGKSLRIFFRDGSVTGIRHAEVYNWTGQAIACPRKRLKELKVWWDDLPGTQSTGVYFLFGRKEADNTVYIGESENTLQRIGHHLTTKDFWNEVVIFTNKDQNLTKAHVQYLEAMIVRRAKETNRYALDNGNSPNAPSLAPAERAPMDEFIDNMRLVLGALGYRLLEPVSEPARDEIPVQKNQESSVKDATDTGPTLDQPLYFSPGGCEAVGHFTDEGFVIKKDSTAAITETDSLCSTYVNARRELLQKGQLKEDGDCYRFTEDILCTSPSYAASIVAGSQRSGNREWRDGSGIPLGQLEEQVKQSLTGGLAEES